jgi:RNA polymerase sigma factor (sigma-70 family)
MAADRLEQLVAETGWLRRLALSLVHDQAAAEDIAHDTLLIAAERPPPEDRPLRPWLARVALNIVRMRGRSAVRRDARATDYRDAELGADRILERVNTQRRLTELVLALDAPYRDVILLHFFEGLSSAEIARRQGVPDGTVRWRLRHAIAELRAKLDEKSTNRAWLGAVGALARPRGGMVVVKKLLLVALALLLITIAIVVGGRVSSRREQGGGRARSGELSRPSTRVPGWVVQPVIRARRIAGRVEYRGSPVEGAQVALRIAEQPDLALGDVVTAADGTFSFAAPPAEYIVIARAPGRTSAIRQVDTHDPHAHPDQLVLELGDCVARALGTVTDAEGTPIARARIGERGLVGVESDVQGHYEMCRPASAISVTFAAAGFGSVTTMFEFLGEIHRDIVLAPEGVIVGHVVSASGPVADANIVATNADGTAEPVEIPAVSTRSNSEGRFQIGGLSPGRYRLQATAMGLGSRRVETFVTGGQTREVTITVEQTSRVAGVVTLNGVPVAGAKVTASGASAVFSQDDGSFAIDGVPHGDIAWQVRGYRLVRVSSAHQRVTLEVSRGRTIRGHVTRDGHAVAGATVMYQHLDIAHGNSSIQRDTVITDGDGAYLFEDAPAGRVSVHAETPDDTSDNGDESVVHVPDDGEAVFDLKLACNASISGRVVDEAGAPIPGVGLDMWMTHFSGTGVTDARGAFHISRLHAGDWNVRVMPIDVIDDHEAFARFPSVHLATDHTAVTGIILTVKLDPLELSGTVVDERGNPLPDVRVGLSDARGSRPDLITALLPPAMLPNPSVVDLPSTISDAHGGFRFTNLPHYAFAVRAYGPDGGQAVTENVPAGTSNVRVVLASSGAIEGTFVGFGPTPAIDATNHLDVARIGAVDGTRFTIAGLHAGTYSVTAQDDHGADAVSIEVRSGQTAHVELHSHGMGRVDVRVVDAFNGQPVGGGRLIVEPVDPTGMAAWWDTQGALLVDDSGRATLSVPAGHMRITFRGTLDHCNAQRDLDIAANGRVSTELASVPIKPGDSGDPGFTMLDDEVPATVLALRADPALHSGLSVGDQILAVDGFATLGPEVVTQLFANHAHGPIVLSIARGTARLTITLGL